MPITIGAKRESDFTDPIGMLGDCHRRIEWFLNVLAIVAAQEMGGPLDEQDRAVLETSLRYFRGAAPSTLRMRKRAYSPVSAESTMPARKPY